MKNNMFHLQFKAKEVVCDKRIWIIPFCSYAVRIEIYKDTLQLHYPLQLWLCPYFYPHLKDSPHSVFARHLFPGL